MTDESGMWHLILAEHVNDYVSSGRNSIVVHQCPQWGQEVRSPIKNLPYEPLGYWTIPKHIKAPCKICGQRVPEAIANLFMLHNFDTFASDPNDYSLSSLSRSVTAAVVDAGVHYDHTFLLADGPCTCTNCISTYGEPK